MLRASYSVRRWGLARHVLNGRVGGRCGAFHAFVQHTATQNTSFLKCSVPNRTEINPPPLLELGDIIPAVRV